MLTFNCKKKVHTQSFSGPYFPAFGLNTDIYSVNLRIQSKCGKIRTRKTRNTDTFYAVVFSLLKTYRSRSICIFIRNLNIYKKIIIGGFNNLMHVPKWSEALQKSCSKIFKVCLTILRHYALKRSKYFLKVLLTRTFSKFTVL